MKRAFIIVALTCLCPPGYLRAHEPVVIGAPLVRVAVVDVGPLYAESVRYKALLQELDKEKEPYDKQRADLKNHISQWNLALQKDVQQGGKILTDRQREQGRRSIIEARRRLEDLDFACSEALGTKYQKGMEALDREFEKTVQDANLDCHAVIRVGELGADLLKEVRGRILVRDWLSALQDVVDFGPGVILERTFPGMTPPPPAPQLFDFSIGGFFH